MCPPTFLCILVLYIGICSHNEYYGNRMLLTVVSCHCWGVKWMVLCTAQSLVWSNQLFTSSETKPLFFQEKSPLLSPPSSSRVPLYQGRALQWAWNTVPVQNMSKISLFISSFGANSFLEFTGVVHSDSWSLFKGMDGAWDKHNEKLNLYSYMKPYTQHE